MKKYSAIALLLMALTSARYLQSMTKSDEKIVLTDSMIGQYYKQGTRLGKIANITTQCVEQALKKMSVGEAIIQDEEFPATESISYAMMLYDIDHIKSIHILDKALSLKCLQAYYRGYFDTVIGHFDTVNENQNKINEEIIAYLVDKDEAVALILKILINASELANKISTRLQKDVAVAFNFRILINASELANEILTRLQMVTIVAAFDARERKDWKFDATFSEHECWEKALAISLTEDAEFLYHIIIGKWQGMLFIRNLVKGMCCPLYAPELLKDLYSQQTVELKDLQQIHSYYSAIYVKLLGIKEMLAFAAQDTKQPISEAMAQKMREDAITNTSYFSTFYKISLEFAQSCSAVQCLDKLKRYVIDYMNQIRVLQKKEALQDGEALKQFIDQSNN